MSNPSGHVVLDEEATHAAKERYVVLEAELQALQARNKELMCSLQVQEEIVAVGMVAGGLASTGSDVRVREPHGRAAGGTKRA